MAHKAVFPWDTPDNEPPIDANIDTPIDRIIIFIAGLLIVRYIWFSNGFSWTVVIGAAASILYVLLKVSVR